MLNPAESLIFVILFSIFHSHYCATLAPLCHPRIIEEMPLHLIKVCLAFDQLTLDQLTFLLRTYINNEATAFATKSDELPTNYGKRTDVDHVFLRFGRKR